MPPLPWKTVHAPEPDTDYVLVLTRLPLRSHLRIPRVMGATLRIVRQLGRSEGLVGYALKADLLHKTFWTMSAWDDDRAVARFVRSEAHQRAMTRLAPHLRASAIETFVRAGAELPLTWSEVAELLRAEPAVRAGPA